MQLKTMERMVLTDFIEKRSARKADKPKAGARSVVETFRLRVAEQKEYLEAYERDPTGFKKWRSTWFQRVPGGFGVSIGRDAVSAGQGLSYVVVETAKEVAEFLDDLAQHAEEDLGFQKALEENRARRAAVLNAAKAQSRAAKSASVKSPARAPRAKTGPRRVKTKAGE
ncbi:hypothetical protein FHT85_006021 [Rhizobium sp. BK312]|uniref:hypothetical protein n=1 Tax=Rhizobium sp. BK312 TaxID=2587080 RepID=UPI00180BFFF4|nr:hypothetical protein [Rhizobium sp. BK312]MBB3428990.1 hypothetical protein [Rhizobium sp. BK312]